MGRKQTLALSYITGFVLAAFAGPTGGNWERKGHEVEEVDGAPFSPVAFHFTRSP